MSEPPVRTLAQRRALDRRGGLLEAVFSMTAAAASVKIRQSFNGSSIYDARAVAAGAAFWFTAPISVFAAGPEEAGFWPVISKPSLTT